MSDDEFIPGLTEEELRSIGLSSAPPRFNPSRTFVNPPRSVYRCNQTRAYEAYCVEMDAFRRFQRFTAMEREGLLDMELEDVESVLYNRQQLLNRQNSPEESSEDEEFLEDWARGWEEEITNEANQGAFDGVCRAPKTSKPPKKATRSATTAVAPKIAPAKSNEKHATAKKTVEKPASAKKTAKKSTAAKKISEKPAKEQSSKNARGRPKKSTNSKEKEPAIPVWRSNRKCAREANKKMKEQVKDGSAF